MKYAAVNRNIIHSNNFWNTEHSLLTEIDKNNQRAEVRPSGFNKGIKEKHESNTKHCERICRYCPYLEKHSCFILNNIYKRFFPCYGQGTDNMRMKILVFFNKGDLRSYELPGYTDTLARLKRITEIKCLT